MKYWYHKTGIGTFYIVRYQRDYDILFEGKHLGSYDGPQQAVNALIGGNTTLSSPNDPGTLGIPEDIGHWKHDISNK